MVPRGLCPEGPHVGQLVPSRDGLYPSQGAEGKASPRMLIFTSGLSGERFPAMQSPGGTWRAAKLGVSFEHPPHPGSSLASSSDTSLVRGSFLCPLPLPVRRLWKDETWPLEAGGDCRRRKREDRGHNGASPSPLHTSQSEAGWSWGRAGQGLETEEKIQVFRMRQDGAFYLLK